MPEHFLIYEIMASELFNCQTGKTIDSWSSIEGQEALTALLLEPDMLIFIPNECQTKVAAWVLDKLDVFVRG